MTYSNQHYESNQRQQAVLSQHARKRAQKRGIDQSAVRLVMAFGKKEFDGRGGVQYLMTADSMASLRRAVGQTQQVQALAGVYVVVSADGETVITVCHRHN